MGIRLVEQNSTRIPGVTDYDYVRDDVEPPLYASIEISSPEQGVTYVTPSGPFTREQLVLFKSMSGQNLNGAGFAKLDEQPTGYSFGGDPLCIRGEYPGGNLRAAFNAASLVLAAEADFSPPPSLPVVDYIVRGFDQLPE